MSLNDDSWKDGYDEWKLRSPDDDEPECDHDDYEIDILTGRAECSFCPHSWYLTAEDMEREIERQATYYEDVEREERRQWWRDLFAPVLDPIRQLRRRIGEWNTRRKYPEHQDDEIPF